MVSDAAWAEHFRQEGLQVALPRQWAEVDTADWVMLTEQQAALLRAQPVPQLQALSVEEEQAAPSIFMPRPSRGLPVLAEEEQAAQPPPPPAQPGPARGSDDGNPWDGMGPENAAVPYAPREAFFFGGNFCLRRVCTEGAAGGEAMQGLERRARGKGIGGYRGKGLGGYRSLRISNVLGGYRSL